MSRGLRLAAGLAIPVLVLAGCSQVEAEAEPVITYPSEAVEETTESPKEAWTVPPKEELYPYAKPEIPPLAQEHSRQGAEAFSKYFLEAYTYAIAIRDKDSLLELCSDRSGFCEHNADLIQKLVDTDSYILDYRVYELETPGSLEGGSNEYVEWGAQVIGYESSYTLHFGDGSMPREFEEFHFVAAVEVSWEDGWKVEEAEIIPYEELYGE